MGSITEISSKKIIFFDGYCNLCNSQVNNILSIDKKNIFHYSALSSKFAINSLKGKIDKKSIGKSIVFLNNGKVYTKSKAVLMILSEIGGFYYLFSFFKIFPSFILDFFYNIIAKNRYTWFGKSDNCFIPTKEISSRFIND